MSWAFEMVARNYAVTVPTVLVAVGARVSLVLSTGSTDRPYAEPVRISIVIGPQKLLNFSYSE
jgi:hypothetical protein